MKFKRKIHKVAKGYSYSQLQEGTKQAKTRTSQQSET